MPHHENRGGRTGGRDRADSRVKSKQHHCGFAAQSGQTTRRRGLPISNDGRSRGRERTGVIRPGYAIDSWQLPQGEAGNQLCWSRLSSTRYSSGTSSSGTSLVLIGPASASGASSTPSTASASRYCPSSASSLTLSESAPASPDKALSVSRLRGVASKRLYLVRTAAAGSSRAGGSWSGPFGSGVLSALGVSWGTCGLVDLADFFFFMWPSLVGAFYSMPLPCARALSGEKY